MVENKGMLEGRYDLKIMPDDMHFRILNAFVITGHNATSNCIQGTVNPFRPITHGYTRTVDFNDGHRLVLNAHCKREGHVINSEFQLNGTIGKHNLACTEPLVEAWVPRRPGQLYGNFTIMWVTDEGKRLVGEAKTDYYLSEDRQLDETLHRFVTIQSEKPSEKTFIQRQQVTLWKSFPQHYSPEEANRILQETIAASSSRGA